jgi:hypothetical protein
MRKKDAFVLLLTDSAGEKSQLKMIDGKAYMRFYTFLLVVFAFMTGSNLAEFLVLH